MPNRLLGSAQLQLDSFSKSGRNRTAADTKFNSVCLQKYFFLKTSHFLDTTKGSYHIYIYIFSLREPTENDAFSKGLQFHIIPKLLLENTCFES